MSPVRIIEVSAWTAGALLLAAYVAVRIWSAQASDAGMKAFREARVRQTSLAEPAQTTATTLNAAAPDTSGWDSRRVAQYRQALTTAAMPQAVLRIPKLALEVPVYEGTSDVTLNRGAGRLRPERLWGGAEPGDLGRRQRAAEDSQFVDRRLAGAGAGCELADL